MRSKSNPINAPERKTKGNPNYSRVAGPVLTAVSVGIALKNIAQAPPGQKLETAGHEGSGIGGAIAGGEIGGLAFSPSGPGAILGALGGALIGGGGGSAMFDHRKDNLNPALVQANDFKQPENAWLQLK